MVLKSIKTGFFLYDGGVLFGVAPKVAWSKAYPADENNFCRLTLRSLLIMVDNRVILVDTGIGTKNAEILADFGYSGVQSWDQLLKPYNLTCDDVTDVVLTSLHFEHCGGCTTLDEEGNIDLTFPNATYHISDEQMKAMINPSERERCMFIPTDIMAALKQDKLNVLKEPVYNLCQGVELKLVTANTVDMIVPYIDEGEYKYIFAGDVIPTSGNVALDWLDAHDLYPVQALDAKDALLKEAVEKDYWIIFPKEDRFDCARIDKDEDYVIAAEGIF